MTDGEVLLRAKSKSLLELAGTAESPVKGVTIEVLFARKHVGRPTLDDTYRLASANYSRISTWHTLRGESMHQSFNHVDVRKETERVQHVW
ncbi:hypothetical protein [Paraburkholderia strydomiana]|uniref:hypothetical protein n=1 Tax=Paraburkholderia strydomiana TaxID=1245417 RepID=UPI0038B6CE0D